MSTAAATDMVALIPASYFERCTGPAPSCVRSNCRCRPGSSPSRRCGTPDSSETRRTGGCEAWCSKSAGTDWRSSWSAHISACRCAQLTWWFDSCSSSAAFAKATSSPLSQALVNGQERRRAGLRCAAARPARAAAAVTDPSCSLVQTAGPAACPAAQEDAPTTKALSHSSCGSSSAASSSISRPRTTAVVPAAGAAPPGGKPSSAAIAQRNSLLKLLEDHHGVDRSDVDRRR